MIKEARKAYLLAIKKRYRQGDRGEKKLILDELFEVCGYASASKHCLWKIELSQITKIQPYAGLLQSQQ